MNRRVGSEFPGPAFGSLTTGKDTDRAIADCHVLPLLTLLETLQCYKDCSEQGLEGRPMLLAEEKTGHKPPANPKEHRKKPLM